MMIEGEGQGLAVAQRPSSQQDQAPMELVQGAAHAEGQPDSVTAIHKCESSYAKKLCIYDLSIKLKEMENYDIGGTYTGSEPDLWFYYSTSVCPGYNYLLNLFVCHRKVGNFSVGVSSSSELTHIKNRNETGESYMPSSLTYFTFRSAQRNESYHLKTYCFSEDDLKALENQTVFIPLSIEMNTPHALNDDVIKRIKLNHDFGDLLAKQEKTDFVLESASRKKFPTHRIILAAHSPILRTMIKNTTSHSEFIDIDDADMELLLQFIYTGTIQNVLKQDCVKLLCIADRFQLGNLFTLTQFAITEQIEIKNAIDIAVISEKYKLEELQASVFEFIKDNRGVLQTEGWKNLTDVNLMKKLFQYLQKKRSSNSFDNQF